jgi:hypothetical protein
LKPVNVRNARISEKPAGIARRRQRGAPYWISGLDLGHQGLQPNPPPCPVRSAVQEMKAAEFSRMTSGPAGILSVLNSYRATSERFTCNNCKYLNITVIRAFRMDSGTQSFLALLQLSRIREALGEAGGIAEQRVPYPNLVPLAQASPFRCSY